MVSDQEIASCVESVLRGSAGGPGEASLAAVLQQAEATLGVDLSHKAGFIRDQMDLFFGPRLQPQPPTKPQPAPPPPQAVVTPAAAVPQPQPQHQHQVLPEVQGQPQAPPPDQQMQPQQQQLPPLQQQLPPLQQQLIFQTIPQLPAMAPVPAVSAPPAVPAMAFYPPPPLAFRYTTGLAGAATGGTVSFQQPAPGAGGTATPTAAPQVTGDNKESTSKRKRGGPGGLNKVCAISPELQTIVGETAMSRTQIVKQLWAYIRLNNLQDPDDKRKIICNDELRVVFETDTTDMFKMNKLLAKHITPLDPKDQVKRMKAPTVAPQPGPPINQPSIVISDALAKFIGTDGTFPQDDALKYLWDYIKANQLEDVINESILCDSKLQELFGCESIPMSGLSEMLGHHFIKKT